MTSFSELAGMNRDIIDKRKREYTAAATWLPFREARIEELFTEDELERVAELLGEMRNATCENHRARLLTEKIDRYAGVLVKLLEAAEIL